MFKQLYIQNLTGSQLEIATVGLIMEKYSTSLDSFSEDKLTSSSEIKKLQNIKMIKLVEEHELSLANKLSSPTAAGVAPDVSGEFFGTMEQPHAVKVAIQKVEEGLNQLKALLSGKSSSKVEILVEIPKEALVPITETETSTDVFPEEKVPAEGIKTTASQAEVDAGEFIPDYPPKGMEPKNDPVKKFLGKPPYNTALAYNEKLKFISDCTDIGMLREIAYFEVPGRVKDMAKKKLREAAAATPA